MRGSVRTRSIISYLRVICRSNTQLGGGGRSTRVSLLASLTNNNNDNKMMSADHCCAVGMHLCQPTLRYALQ